MGKTFRREKSWGDEPIEYRTQKSKKKFVKDKRSKNKRPRLNNNEERLNNNEEYEQYSVYHR